MTDEQRQLAELAAELEGLGTTELGDFRLPDRHVGETPSSEHVALDRTAHGFAVVYHDMGYSRTYGGGPDLASVRELLVDKVLVLARDRGQGRVVRPGAADPEAERAAVEAAYVSAVKQGRRHRGVVFRGRPHGADVAEAAGVLTTSGLLATSRDVRVATENLTAPGVYVVLVRTRGRVPGDLAAYPLEQEVDLLPRTRLVVAATGHDAGLPVVVLVEEGEALGDDPSTVKLGAYAAQRLREAREGVPVEITSPGKYLGPIS